MLQKINISNKFGSFLFMKDAANQHIRMWPNAIMHLILCCCPCTR